MGNNGSSAVAPKAFPLKAIAGLGLAVSAATAIGVFAGSQGLLAEVTDTKIYQSQVQSGTVALAADGAVEGTFSDSVANLMPGVKTGGKTIEIKNSGTLQFGSVQAAYQNTGTLTDSPAPTATYIIRSDTGVPTTKVGVGGTPVQTTIESCTVNWNGDTCPGVKRVELAPGVYSSRVVYSVASAANLMPGQSVFLKTFYTLPVTAGQEYSGATSTTTNKFTAQQRDPVTANRPRSY